MYNFYGINSNSVNTLFSSLSAGNKNSSIGYPTNMLSDYYSIRSGSYKKLLNAYYEKYGQDNSKFTQSTSTSVSSDSAAKITETKSASSKLQSAASKLLNRGKDSLFKQVEVKDEDGNVTKDYDREAIYSAVKDFTDSYNEVVEAGENSKSSRISKAAERMISTTKANQKLLSEIGISIDKTTNKLSINKEKFDDADISAIKSLFNESGSYGYYMTTKSSEMNAAAVLESSKANTYTNSGLYSSSVSTGDLYDSLF